MARGAVQAKTLSCLLFKVLPTLGHCGLGRRSDPLPFFLSIPSLATSTM